MRAVARMALKMVKILARRMAVVEREVRTL
jgi:hypothetical protein